MAGRLLAGLKVLALLIAAFGVLAGGPALATDSVSYTYDALGRVLTAVYSSGASVTYTYDAAGNRTGQTVAGAQLIITTQSLPTPVIGQSYNQTIMTANGAPPVSFAVTTGTYRRGWRWPPRPA